jgi:chondroitin sulfate proteoglycan 4
MNMPSFSLDQLEQGLVSFQHYYAIDSDLIKLNITVNLANSNVTLPIFGRPYDPTVSFVDTPTDILVKEKAAVIIKTNATSDTQCVYKYVILDDPQYGILEISNDNKHSWSFFSSNNSLDNYAQFDATLNSIRYRQTELISSQVNDTTRIQVYCYQFPGPIHSLNIIVLPQNSLPKPLLTYTIANLSLHAGGSLTLNRNAFSFSLIPSQINLFDILFSVTLENVNLSINITKLPDHGAMYINNTLLSLSSVILYDDIISNRISYYHNGSVNNDELIFNVLPTSVASDLPISLPDPLLDAVLPILIVSSTPALVQYQPVSPFEGAYIVLNTSIFDVIDGDDTDHLVIINNSSSMGHFANEEYGSRLSQFNMSQLRNGEIMYVYQHLNGILNFNETLTVTDGLHFVVQELQISVKPLLISASLLKPDNSSCFFTINAIQEHQSSLPENLFNITLNYKERLPEVMVDVILQPTHGSLSIHNETVMSYSFPDLVQRNVIYTLNNRASQHISDSFSLQFSIGHGRSDILTVPVCIVPLPYPRLYSKTPLTVDLNGKVTITSHNLSAISTHNDPSDVILYRIVRFPLSGVLVNINTVENNITTFTQHDIDNGSIIYNHEYGMIDNSNITDHTDSFQFVISNNYYKLDKVHTMPIDIITLSPLVAINTGFNVTEGQEVKITPDQLYAVAPSGYTITIYIIVHPKEGWLWLKRPDPAPRIRPSTFLPSDIFNGYVTYNHNIKSEIALDEFIVLIVAQGLNNTLPFIKPYHGFVLINVNPTNNNFPEADYAFDIEVFEYGTFAITTDVIRFSDRDRGFNSSYLQYFFKWNLFNGELCLRNNCVSSTTSGEDKFSWYQYEMQQGDLYYRHLGVLGSKYDYLFFDVSDGLNVVLDNFISIEILDTIATPIGNASVKVTENSKVVILPENIEYSVMSVESVTLSDIKYKISKYPSYGQLLNATNNQPITNFTQAHINSTEVVYQQNGDNVLNDSFSVTVSIHHFTAQSVVDIIISPVDDEVPSLQIHRQLFVHKGSIAHINSSIMSIFDEDTKDSRKLKYFIISTAAGRIEKSSSSLSSEYTETNFFTQFDLINEKVRYVHNLATALTDSIKLHISDSTNNVSTIYTLNVVVIPDRISVTIHNLIVYEGGMASTSASSIIVHHPYFSTVDAKVTLIQSPQSGFLQLNSRKCMSPCEFQLSDVQNGHLKYVHNDSEIPKDAFHFYLKWPEDAQTNTVVFLIDVLPVNDQPPRIVNNSQLNVYASQSIVLTPHHLYADDLDTPPELLLYKFDLIPFQHVYFGYFSVNDTITDNFTQADINLGRVVFNDKHENDGRPSSLNFFVSDGINNASGVFTIDPSLVVVEFKPPQNPPVINVQMGHMVTITNHVLFAFTNKELVPSIVQYIIDPTKGQHYGYVIRNDSTFNISQSDIDKGLVFYQHTAVDIWEPTDYVYLTAFHPLALTNISITLQVNIQLTSSSDSLLATNEKIKLKENNFTCLDEDHLDARNIRYYTWKKLNNSVNLSNISITFKVTRWPAHGHLYKLPNIAVANFSQDEVDKICYQNDGSENDTDSFQFEVLIQNAQHQTLNKSMDTMYISIELYNDEQPVMTSTSLNKTFVHNFSNCLTTEDLNVIDGDNKPHEITYVITKPPMIGKLNHINKSHEVTNFTQADIDNCRIVYLSNITGKTSFEFTFTDGSHTSSPFVFNINVDELYLDVVHSKDLTYPQSQTFAYITNDILGTETNGVHNETIFTVTGGLLYGELVISNEVSSKFTQSQIDKNLVMYSQKNPAGYHDHINLTISNSWITINKIMILVNVVVQGEVHNVTLNSSMSQSLPPDLIVLSDLPTHKSPYIEVMSTLNYGYISYKYPNLQVSTNPISRFRYDELKRNMVYFTWRSDIFVQANHSCQEVIMGLVQVDGWIPGAFELTMTLNPPSEKIISPFPSTISPYSSTDTTSVPIPTIAGPSDGTDNFQYSFYIPLIGLVVVILILLVVMVVFCCMQCKSIKQKLETKNTMPQSFPIHKLTSPVGSPSRLPHLSPPLTGEIAEEYSDSESSSAADIMMVHTTQNQPHSLTTTGHMHIPCSQEYISSGYYTSAHTNSMETTPFPDAISYSSIQVDGSHHRMDQFIHNQYLDNVRSTSPVRKVRMNSYASLSKVSAGRSSPVKSIHDYPQMVPINFSRPESSSSVGYESSNLTQDSYRISRPSSVMTSVKAYDENQQDTATQSYRTTHPVLKGPQYWV